jgi:hypothetical protein
MKFLLTIIIFYFSILSPVSATELSYWSNLAKRINTLIQQSEAQYGQGDTKAAKRSIVKAYFGVFEDKKMEAAMRMELGAKYTYKVEKKFGSMRKLINKNSPEREIQAISKDIQSTMTKDALKLDKAGIPSEVFAVNQ